MGATMALYKYSNFVRVAKDPIFDVVVGTGLPAPRTGIYRCVGCGIEKAFAQSTFFGEGDHRHSYAEGAVRWQLTVMANPS